VLETGCCIVGGEMSDQGNAATTKRTGRSVAAGGIARLLLGCTLFARQDAVNISRGDFGWPSVMLSNATAEVIVVPSIGRVMSFRLVRPGGAGDGTPFWQNAAVRGKPVDPASNTWLNFGGDKTWPAPQSQWPRVAGRAWPPPAGFDAAVNQAELSGTAGLGPNQMALVAPVDAKYGIRVRRVITLDEKRPLLTIETTYTKVTGPEVRMSVWVVTQARSPERVFAVAAAHSKFHKGFQLLSQTMPTDLRRDGELVSMTRGRQSAAKVGVDGDTLIWVGKADASSKGAGLGTTLRIDTSTPTDDQRDAEWPDQGCHAEIYTNPDNSDLGPGLAYVEMETLGPLRSLKQGESITQTTIYKLRQRTETDPIAEARKVLAE
jgi:hypothetical protein